MRDELLNDFKNMLRKYPTFGLDRVQREMSLSEYLDLVDSEAEQKDDGNE